MKYFYIHPFKPQYFFPKGFIKHPVFTSFFKPYSRFGSISWWLFSNFSFYRLCFSQNKIENFIPEKKIRKIIASEALMAFNTGTKGLMQKVTALGWDEKEYFFIKYGETEIARKNVNNEGLILKQICHLDFVPQLLNHVNECDFALIKTNVLKGVRLSNQKIDNELLSILIRLGEENKTVERDLATSVLTCFAHGDFCPWNMMIDDKKIQVFDWEMAGFYPFGYDLFTFIYQTSFLLTPNKSNTEILEDNMIWIQRFFDHFDVKDIKQYLILFVTTKLESETSKGKASKLAEKYLQLQRDLQNLKI